MKQTLYEWCPYCETEIHVCWDIETQGFLTSCPSCSHKLLLCGECTDNCHYDHRTDLCRHIVEAIWEALTDIPLETSENAEEYIAEPTTLHGISFPPGVTRTELWHWFDEHHPQGVAYLLYDYPKRKNDKGAVNSAPALTRRTL